MQHHTSLQLDQLNGRATITVEQTAVTVKVVGRLGGDVRSVRLVLGLAAG